MRRRLGQGFAHQHNVRTPGRGASDLRRGGEFRHDDRGGDTKQLGMPRDGLRVVARRHGDHAAIPLRGRQHRKPVGGATFLESTGDLKIVELEHDLGAGQARNRVTGQHWCPQHTTGDTLGGLLNVLERYHRKGVYA
jgi:hypothetical protein